MHSVDAGRTLREARSEARITQKELAGRAGTSQATISAYESGRKQPSVATLGRLLEATGTRLITEPDAMIVQPSAAQHRRAAETLSEVLALAEALPTRHHDDLRYPPLTLRRAS